MSKRNVSNFSIFNNITNDIPVSNSKLFQLFVSGKKKHLSYERCTCFDSDLLTAQRAASADRVWRSFLSDGSLSKHSANFSLLSICIWKIVYGFYFGVYRSSC